MRYFIETFKGENYFLKINREYYFEYEKTRGGYFVQDFYDFETSGYPKLDEGSSYQEVTRGEFQRAIRKEKMLRELEK